MGFFSKEPSGAITFLYEDSWLNGDYQIPISLSLPLREDIYRGEVVFAVFENLLPDSDQLRRRVAEKVGADGVDAYSLLSIIGRDCVGGVQFIADDADCSTCHGEGPLGAPPAGLVTDPDGPGVGAHARLLDPTPLDRVGKVASCRDCHEVPELVADEGHLDAQAPADVVLRNGESYDPVARTCTVGCHWDLEPGPAWGDTSGAPRDCDGCHGMPPVMTRAGGPHPPSPGGATSCLGCHPIDPAIHVNGTVDFQW